MFGNAGDRAATSCRVWLLGGVREWGYSGIRCDTADSDTKAHLDPGIDPHGHGDTTDSHSGAGRYNSQIDAPTHSDAG